MAMLEDTRSEPNGNGDATREYLQRLTQREAFLACKTIEEHGKLDEHGFWVYDPGWDDRRVAKECNIDSTDGVKYRRVQVFGKTRPYQGRTPDGRSSDVDKLEAKLNELAIANHALRVDNYKLTKRLEFCEKAINTVISAPIFKKDGMDDDMKTKLKGLQEHFAKPSELVKRPGTTN